MRQSRLRDNFLNIKMQIDRKAYNKQRNCCFSLIRKARPKLFDNINTTDLTDNKTFCRTIKSFFTDKVTARSKITSIEKNEVQRKIMKR